MVSFVRILKAMKITIGSENELSCSWGIESLSVLENKTQNVILSVLKHSEDEDSYIIRGYETQGKKSNWNCTCKSCV